MSKEKLIRDEVNKTLEIMDRLEDIEAGPYFYTRLEAELRSRQRAKKGLLPDMSQLAHVFSGRVLRPALLTLLMIINIFSAAFFLLESGAAPSGREKEQASLSAFVEEYSSSWNTYDIDVPEKMAAGDE
ncbi:MAG: hypothetical protein KAW12_03830 [Candidatus Aminicenantes bacterium]|nr:hypothetical protein [Candidatus Aminicenantes bacterium]